MTGVRRLLTALVTNPVAIGLLVVALFAGAGWMSGGTLQILTFLLVNILLAQSMNLLTGVAGQISLGHAGFFGMGAYASGILMKSYGLGFVATVPAAVAVAALTGLLVSFPAGRVREFYLAMMTLAFGLIFREVVREWNDVTGGAMGLSGVPSPMLRTLVIFDLKIDAAWYFRIVLIITAAVMWLLHNFIQSRFGRAFYAIHVSEVAAGSIGIPRAATKRLAYVLSGALAGLAGAFYAHLVGYLGPESFDLPRSVEVLVTTVVGGLGSMAGQVLSAVLFTFLPEKLQVFAQYQFIVYGIILAFSLIVIPRGLAGLLLLPPRFVKRAALRRVGDAAEPIRAVQATSEPGLRVERVTMRFGGLTAVDDVSLSLQPGRITALIGPNGSGKSTLINVISGIYQPSSGVVRFFGRAITGMADHRIAASGLVRTFQDPRLVPSFTVRENLLLGAHRLFRRNGLAAALNLPGAIREEGRHLATVEAVLRMAGLAEVADRTIESLPYGYRRLVEVGRALLAEPRAILLDEPAAGLTEAEMALLARLIRAMKQAGLMVLLIEHHMDFVAELVDDVVVLDSGRVIYHGDVQGMRRDPQVIAAYLGETEDVDA
ncbi:MAG: branched-chain amino acid ABC transporter ATP-binding protein/permease [Alphaproteobacteria bacterium]|nr:branched-chain amino acid ABC transporter ATP-binding protein/permease [Alphaproteobacteria bacterium]